VLVEGGTTSREAVLVKALLVARGSREAVLVKVLLVERQCW
jgi:hypothetical protein